VIKQLQTWFNLQNPSKKFFMILTTLFVAVVLWLSLARVDITIQANGVTEPSDSITELGTMATGKVIDVRVKPGDAVKKGDIIMIISPGVGYEDIIIDAPIDGKILNLFYRNPGAVVKQGQSVTQLVPTDQKCVIVARLPIKDRGYVFTNQSAKIRLANKDSMRFAPIIAKVTSISPDTIKSQNESYYEVKLELEQQYFTDGNIRYDLVSGIQTQVYIVTGSRSIMDYLLSPFMNNVQKGLQEK
jgi:multidrug efflux pump subunit AcrA (membrane-fusion protein)